MCLAGCDAVCALSSSCTGPAEFGRWRFSWTGVGIWRYFGFGGKAKGISGSEAVLNVSSNESDRVSCAARSEDAALGYTALASRLCDQGCDWLLIVPTLDRRSRVLLDEEED